MELLKFSVFLVLFSTVKGVKVEVLSPVSNSTIEAGLIITPGADINGQAYRPLAEAIQKATPLKLWVALLEDFPLDVPNPVQLDSAVNEAIDKMGVKNGNVFLAGHSLGGKTCSTRHVTNKGADQPGHLCQRNGRQQATISLFTIVHVSYTHPIRGGVFVGNYGLSNSKKLKGILLFASYLTRSHKLHEYPLPVLHISGDLDGLTRITRIVDTFEELLDDMQTSGHSTMYHTPVIVMEGVNHGHFASGTMPPNVKSHDLLAEMPYDSAHTLIAGHVSAFLVESLQQPSSQVSDAEKALNKSFEDTLAITKPLSMVKSWDTIGGNENATTKRAQEVLLGNKLAGHVEVVDSVISETEMLVKEPSAESDGDNHASIRTFSHVSMPFDPEDVSQFPQTPTEVQSKMMTKEDLMVLLPNISADNTTNTCMEINQKIYRKAISLASERAHKRYASHGSPPITFHHDDKESFAVQWLSSSLKLIYGPNGALDVTSRSYVLLPSVGDSNNSYRKPTSFIGRRKRKTNYSQGYYYCKLLSPYRALEWYYIDSLKTKS